MNREISTPALTAILAVVIVLAVAMGWYMINRKSVVHTADASAGLAPSTPAVPGQQRGTTSGGPPPMGRLGGVD